jgi:hypothetical protein
LLLAGQTTAIPFIPFLLQLACCLRLADRNQSLVAAESGARRAKGFATHLATDLPAFYQTSSKRVESHGQGQLLVVNAPVDITLLPSI